MNPVQVIILLIILLLTSQQSLADCKQLNQKIFSKISFVKTSVDCHFLDQVISPLAAIQDFFNKKTQLTLFIRDRGMNASFDQGQIIWLPKKLYAYNERSQPIIAETKALAPILLHEIGHAFLIERFQTELHLEFGDLFSQLASVSENTLRNTLSGKPSMSSRRFGNHLAQTDDFRKYTTHVVGYSELYADAVSVLFFNDPEVMYHSLEFATHTEFERQFIRARSFSQRHEVPSENELITVHTEFAPVRSHLGQRLQALQSANDRLRLLQALENSIVAQIKEELQLAQLSSLHHRNQQLIQKIEARFLNNF